MKSFSKILIIITIFGFFSCKDKEKPDGVVVAKVYDNYLTEQDLLEILPDGMPKEDSVLQVEKYIEMWVKEQLLLEKAKSYLKDEQKDIDEKVEDFKTSLLIHKYKEKFLNQKLDTIVTHKEINDYYTANIQDFVLNKNVIKGFYIKIKKDEPEINNLKSWIHSNDIGNLVKIRDFSITKAEKFTDFNNDWIYLSNVIYEMDYEIENENNFLKSHKYFEKEDDVYFYFVKILDYKLKNETSPLIFNIENIKSIILNRRSSLMVDELEKTIRDNADKNKNIEIY